MAVQRPSPWGWVPVLRRWPVSPAACDALRAEPGKAEAVLRNLSKKLIQEKRRRDCSRRPLSRPKPEVERGLILALLLALGAAQRRAENVAEAGARVRRPEFLHGLLLFFDFLRLDRQADTAAAAIDLGDLGVDLFADGETIRTLFGTLTRQIGLADEAGEPVGDRDFDTAIGDGGDGRGDDVALLHAGSGTLERIRGELLDAQADALFLDIDVENLDLDLIALLELGDGFFARLVPVDIGHVDHAVDIAGQTNEQTELGDVLDFAFQLGARRELVHEGLPRVVQALLEAQADAALLGIDVQHHDFDFLRGRNDLAGMDVLLGPGHL